MKQFLFMHNFISSDYVLFYIIYIYFYFKLYNLYIKGVLIMSQATFSIRMDEDLKKQFDSICEEMGMSATTAFNVFARTVVREKRIPFEISASTQEPVNQDSISTEKLLKILSDLNN